MRKIKLTHCVSMLAAAGLLSLSAVAVQAQTHKDSNKAKPIEIEQITQTSAEMSAELGKKWGKVLAEGYGMNEQGIKQFVSGYANYPQDVLKSALNAKNFEAMNRTLMDHNQALSNALAEKISNEEGSKDVEIHKIKSDLRKSLGDEARDLVFIPIAPCRTFDTRFSTIGATYAGTVSPGSPKDAYVYWGGSSGAWLTDGYGGTADCPQTTTNTGPLAGTAPYASVMNLTVISPVGTGWVTTYRNDLPDPSATVVGKFVQNGVTDTALLVTNVCRGATGASCNADIKIASRGTTAHVAGDVVGYFIKPQATALSCVRENLSISAPPGLTANFGNTCRAGYTLTGVGCYSFVAGVATGSTAGYASTPTTGYSAGGNSYCAVNNTTGANATVNIDTFCCRVPGR